MDDPKVGKVETPEQQMVRLSAEIESAVQRGIVADNATLKRRNRVLVIGVSMLLAMQIFQTGRTVFVSGPILSRLDAQAGALEEQREVLGEVQIVVDDLQAYVNDLRARRDDGPDPATVNALRQIAEIRALLCQIDDPVRAEACSQFTDG